jgi:hypothetical protein
MKTLGKILLFTLLALVALHLFPILLLPVGLSVAALFALGAVLVGVLAALLGTGLSLVAAVLAVALVLLAVTAPLWLPALAIYGLIKLCSRNRPVAA